MKFCPIAKMSCENGMLETLGLLCEQWDPDRRGCQHSLYYAGIMAQHEAYMKSLDVQQKVQTGFLENQRREELISKLNLELLKRVPDLSDEEKSIIQQALDSEDNDEAERLLRQAGLIGGSHENPAG